MSTCRDIIVGALRRLAVLRPGDSPLADHIDYGLERLQALYDSLMQRGAFGSLNDVYVTTATYTAKEQDRILCTNAAGTTVTLPDTIVDCITGENRAPFDASLVVITDLQAVDRTAYVYDANTGRWVALPALALTDEAPLSTRFRTALEANLAMTMADTLEVQPTPLLQQDAARGLSAFSFKWDKTRRDVAVDFF